MCTKCMKKRRTSQVSGIMNKGTSTMIKQGVAAGAGFVGSRIISNIPFVAQNKFIRVLAPFGGAILVKSFMGKKGDGIAVGMATGGVINAVQEFAPGIAAQAGLSGFLPTRSAYTAGVSGPDGYPNVVLG